MNFSSAEWINLIAASAAAVCAIIAALKSSSTNRNVEAASARAVETTLEARERLVAQSDHLRRQDRTLEAIHEQTNGNLSELKAENERLKAALAASDAARRTP